MHRHNENWLAQVPWQIMEDADPVADGGANNTGDGTKKPGIKIKPEEAEIILTGVEHRHYDIHNIYNM